MNMLFVQSTLFGIYTLIFDIILNNKFVEKWIHLLIF